MLVAPIATCSITMLWHYCLKPPYRLVDLNPRQSSLSIILATKDTMDVNLTSIKSTNQLKVRSELGRVVVQRTLFAAKIEGGDLGF